MRFGIQSLHGSRLSAVSSYFSVTVAVLETFFTAHSDCSGTYNCPSEVAVMVQLQRLRLPLITSDSAAVLCTAVFDDRLVTRCNTKWTFDNVHCCFDVSLAIVVVRWNCYNFRAHHITPNFSAFDVKLAVNTGPPESCNCKHAQAVH